MHIFSTHYVKINATYTTPRMQDQKIIFQVGDYYFSQINEEQTQQGIQNILVCDISGSMREYWRTIQSTYNKLATKLRGNTTIILFNDVAQITKYSGLPFDCVGGRTNIVDALTKLESVYDPILYANTNVIFITDGEDTSSSNFNDLFANKINNFKKITNHLNFYVFGIGNKFPTFISQLIRNKLHTGSSMIKPIFSAMNGSSAEIICQFDEIFDNLEKFSQIEITNNVRKSPYDQEYSHKITSGDYVLFDNINPTDIIVLNNKPYQISIFSPTTNVLLELFSQWVTTLQTASLNKNMINEAIILKDTMSQMYSEVSLIPNTSKLSFADRIKMKEFKNWDNKFNQLLNLVKEIASGIKLSMLANEKLAQKLGSVHTGTYAKKHFTQHEYTDNNFNIDKQYFANIVNNKKDHLQKLSSNNPDRCIITLDNFYEILSDDNFNSTLLSPMCDKVNFIKSFGVTGVGVFFKITNSSGINPWTVQIENVGKFSSIISLTALEDMFDSEVVTIPVGNGKSEVINGLIPLVCDDVAEPIVLSNLFQMICTYTIMKSFGTLNYDAHLGGLSSLMSYLLDLKQSEWVDNLMNKIIKTASLYKKRKSIKQTIDLIWTDPNIAVITDYKSTNLENRTESLNKILLCMLISSSDATKSQIYEVLFHVLKEFIGRSLPSDENISNWFECTNIDEIDSQISYQPIENLYEEKYTLEKTIKNIQNKIRDTKFDAPEISFSTNLTQLYNLKSFSAGIINYKKILRFCKMFDCEFSDEDVIRLVVHAFKFSDSNDRSKPIDDYASSINYVKFNLFSNLISKKKDHIMKQYTKLATKYYTEKFYQSHTLCTFPLTKEQIIKLANEKNIDVNAETFDQIYTQRPNGLLSNACCAFNCKYFLQPRQDFNSHYQLLVQRNNFIHAFHMTIHEFKDLTPSLIKNKVKSGELTINKQSYLDVDIDDTYLLTNVDKYKNMNNFDDIDNILEYIEEQRKHFKQIEFEHEESEESNESKESNNATESAIDIPTYRCRTVTSSNFCAMAILLPSRYVAHVNQIRSLYDKAYEKWVPHINLLYPFVDETELEKVIPKLTTVFGMIQPFELKLDSVEYFDQGPSLSYHLTTSEISYQLMSLTNILHQLLPNVKKTHAEFKPHLTIGQFSKEYDMTNIKKYFKDPIIFTVDQIHIITRSKTTSFKTHTVFDLKLNSANKSVSDFKTIDGHSDTI